MFRALLWGVVAVAFAMAPSAALAKRWKKAETEHFLIYSSSDTKRTVAYAHSLEAFYQTTDYFYSQIGDSALPLTGKVRFNFMEQVREYTAVRPTIEENAFNPFISCEDGAQFFSTAEVEANNEYFQNKKIDKDLDLDLSFLYFSLNNKRIIQYFEKSPPIWVRTGLNWYFMTAVIKDGKIVLGKPAPKINLTYSKFGKFKDLSTEEYAIPYGDIIGETLLVDRENSAYTLQAWVMVSYLMATPERRAQLARYVRLVAEGKESLAAFKEATGLEPEFFDSVMDGYMSKGVPLTIYTLKATTDSDVALTDLPDYDVPVPLLDAATQLCPSNSYADTLVRKLEKAAETHGDDVLTRKALARAQIISGNPIAARDWLTKRISTAPHDAEARLLMGQMYLALAYSGPIAAISDNFAAARRELGVAYKLDEGSAPTLYYFARAQQDMANYPSDNVLAAAELAHSYSGGSYGVFLAELYVRRGDYDKALEYFPSGKVFGYADKDLTALATKVREAIIAHQPAKDILALLDEYRGEVRK